MSPRVASQVQPRAFVELLPQPPEKSTTGDPFELHVVESTPLHASGAFAKHALGLYTGGRHRIRRGLGRPIEGWSDPGAFNLTPAGIGATWEATAPSRAIVFCVSSAHVSRLIEEDWDVDPRGMEIVPRFLTRDPVIETVLTRLAMEVDDGSPNGNLYRSSACEFLAHHLVRAHSSISRAPLRSFGGLSPRRLKLVIEYIDANLGGSLTHRDLATLAGVSARHFERAFRNSVGSPPHAFVLRKRVGAARDLLVNRPTLTIAEIADRVGFASASHLVTVFRRHVGCTPAAFRRLNA